VYKAQHKTTGQLAAAKMCVLDNEDDLADFTVEIDILSECRHPNVVELHEAYFIDNKLWMLLEYCDGGALDSVMSELEKGLSELQIAYVCREMCRGLHFLHSRRVIHRDLKAGNVLATMTGGVKLGELYVFAPRACSQVLWRFFRVPAPVNVALLSPNQASRWEPLEASYPEL
ncbi:jg9559, partial [Pararge aegeria aegeria]